MHFARPRPRERIDQTFAQWLRINDEKEIKRQMLTEKSKQSADLANIAKNTWVHMTRGDPYGDFQKDKAMGAEARRLLGPDYNASKTGTSMQAASSQGTMQCENTGGETLQAELRGALRGSPSGRSGSGRLGSSRGGSEGIGHRSAPSLHKEQHSPSERRRDDGCTTPSALPGAAECMRAMQQSERAKSSRPNLSRLPLETLRDDKFRNRGGSSAGGSNFGGGGNLHGFHRDLFPVCYGPPAVGIPAKQQSPQQIASLKLTGPLCGHPKPHASSPKAGALAGCTRSGTFVLG